MGLGCIHHPQPSQLLSQPWAWSHGAQSHCELQLLSQLLNNQPSQLPSQLLLQQPLQLEDQSLRRGRRWQRQGWLRKSGWA